MKMYLAGPIEKCNYDEIHNWRSYVDSKLNSTIITIYPKILCSNDS